MAISTVILLQSKNKMMLHASAKHIVRPGSNFHWLQKGSLPLSVFTLLSFTWHLQVLFLKGNCVSIIWHDITDWSMCYVTVEGQHFSGGKITTKHVSFMRLSTREPFLWEFIFTGLKMTRLMWAAFCLNESLEKKG